MEYKALGRMEIEDGIIAKLTVSPYLINQFNLTPEDFKSQSNSEILKTMLAWPDREWDFKLLYHSLQAKKDRLHLNEITGHCSMIPQTFKGYVGFLRRTIAEEIVDEISNEVGTEDPLIFAAAIQERANELTDDDVVIEIKRVVKSVYGKLENTKQGKPEGILSGFKQLDNYTGGFQPSTLYILAASSSMGKTAFAVNIILNAAMKGNSIYFSSLEQSSHAIACRMISREARIANQNLQRGIVSDNEWSTLADTVGAISGLPIFIDDSAGISSLEICRRIRKTHAAHPLNLVVIDHIQEVREKKCESRRLEVSTACSNIRALGKELKIPIILLSQLRRNSDKASNRPSINQLKESGDLEAQADTVLLMYRESYYDPKPENEGIMEILVAKNRDGANGVITLSWNPEYMQFS